MRCPCIECDKKGCGAYHDKCEPYQAFFAYRNEVNQRRAAAFAQSKIYEPDKKFKQSIVRSVWSKHIVKKGLDHYGLIDGGEENG